MDDISGRVALVTGGSRGIGRAVALALAEAGADVAVNYHRNREAAEEVAAAIARLGRRAVAIAADVARGEEVRRLLAETEQRLGPVAILVNNAGISRPSTLDALDAAMWDETIAANLTSVFLVTQAVLPGMRARRCGIIGPHYAASKAGIHGMTHAYAGWLVREGITANAIAPALIETDMIRGHAQAKPERIPVGRFGRPEEVAEVAVMLARNGYITGQTVNVNGGAYMS